MMLKYRDSLDFKTVFLLLILPCVDALAEPSETSGSPSLVGNWICQEGPCLDEEIQFAIEDDEPVYNSWLHARPSASGGSWSLEGDQLTINCCGGLEMIQTVVEVGESTLRLRDLGEDETAEVAVYSRVE